MTIPPDWLALNLANWNERVPIHLNARRCTMISIRSSKANNNSSRSPPASWDQLTACACCTCNVISDKTR